jgi:formiminotetrahydrofolate cyclodeaminase
MSTQRFAELPVGEFLARLASAEPVPGGGSASALAAGFAAGLVAMVARLSLGRPRYAAYEATHQRALAYATEVAPEFLDLADRDAEAYARFAAALKLPRESPDEQAVRTAATRSAARHAAEVPLQVVRRCAGLAAEIEAMAGRSNLNASSDINVAALLVEAAGRGAAANVLVNLPAVGDEAFAGQATDEVMRLLGVIEDLAAHARERVGAGRLRDPEGE